MCIRDRAWILGALAAAYLAGPPGALFLAAFVVLQGLRELLSRRGISQGRDYASMAVLFYGALPLAIALVPWSGYGRVSPGIGIAGLVLVLAAWTSSPPGDARRRAFRFHLGLLGTLWGLPHVAALWYLRPQAAPASGPLLAGFLLLVVQSSDVAQYVSGRLLGRHPLSARSPSKTWEGFAGGLLFAVGLGVLLHGSTPFTWRQGAALALVVYLLGVLGTTFHLANGVHTASFILGLAASPQAQRRMQALSVALFLLLLGIGWGAVAGLFEAGRQFLPPAG